MSLTLDGSLKPVRPQRRLADAHAKRRDIELAIRKPVFLLCGDVTALLGIEKKRPQLADRIAGAPLGLKIV